VKQFLCIGQTLVSSVMILTLTAVMGGCIVLPVPTLDHGEGLSEGQVHERLAGGQFTRADVLLTLGPPRKNMERDRYFVYRWERSHWSWVWLFFIPIPPFGGVAGGDDFGVYAPQYLAIEFNPKGELLRYKYFSRWRAGSRDDEFFDKIFPEWVNEPHSALCANMSGTHCLSSIRVAGGGERTHYAY